MANLKEVIYLSNEDYATLVSTGAVTIDGETLIYDENNIYVTPDVLASSANNGLMSAADKAKLDALDDSNLVHKTGDETITGKKSFGQTVTISGNNALINVNGAGGINTFLAYHPEFSGDSKYLVLDNISLFNPNASGYGLTMPETSAYAEDKTIAVEDELTVVERYI